MRRLVLIMSRRGDEVSEGIDVDWMREVSRRPWTRSERDSMIRVRGRWFSRFGEDHRELTTDVKFADQPEGVGR